MTVEELIIRASVQIYQADKSVMKPEGFGTGFIANYLDKKILISVSHVTNDDGLTTFLETNLPPENNSTPLKPIGGLVFYDLLKVTEDMNLNEFEKLIENGERIDITFAEIKDKFELRQPAMDFGSFKIENGHKIILDLDRDVADPDKNHSYGFYGKVRPEYQGVYLKMTPTLKYRLKFHRTNGYFHMFLAPEIIQDKNDYKGCSGAPIIDSEGKVVALACKIVENTKIVYGFSIQECMKLIKMTNDINQL